MIVTVTQEDGTTRNIGEFENGIFTSERRVSRHLFRAYDAWGVDLQGIEWMKAQGLYKVVINDTESRKHYEIGLDKIIAEGIFVHFVPHRPQLLLPLRFWDMKPFGGG